MLKDNSTQDYDTATHSAPHKPLYPHGQGTAAAPDPSEKPVPGTTDQTWLPA